MATVTLTMVRLSSLVTTEELGITKNSAGKPGHECLCVCLCMHIRTRVHLHDVVCTCVSVLDNYVLL